MKSQKGFVTVWMLSVIPIVLVLLALAAALGLSRLEYAKKMHACREGVLEIQQDIAKTTNQLVALNPLAKQLRIQRRISDEAVRLKLETVPYVNIAVGVHRAATLLAQYALKAKQDYLRFSILVRTGKKLLDIRSEMMKLHGNSQDSKTFIVIPAPKFKMRRTPEDSVTPDYNPVENFERVQAIKIRFYFDPNYYVGRLAHLALLQTDSQKIGRLQRSQSQFWAECSATLKQEEDKKWYPKIGTAKF